MTPSGSATLPWGYHFNYVDRPVTPEPTFAMAEQEPPPAPGPTRAQPRPPPRLRVKRRNISVPSDLLFASTDPVPTIEVQDSIDSLMVDGESLSSNTSSAHGLFSLQLPDPSFVICPKTPVLCSDEDSRRPDWARGDSMSSDNDDFLERPTSSTSSTYSQESIRSYVSSTFECATPDSDVEDPFSFPVYQKEHIDQWPGRAVLNQNIRNKKSSDAPWTKSMSAHLWAVYLMYLEDPTVTPHRIGLGSVPPEGVCYRVAREAKRSWKGEKVLNSRSATRADEGSDAPVSHRSWPQWPHSSAATRSHLRELTKNQGGVAVRHHKHFQTRGTTPFSKPSRFRASLPDGPSRPFATHDIAMSLATSTADSMQPDGPLALLASGAHIEPTPDDLEQPRYSGMSKTYGPSSSFQHPNSIRRLLPPFVYGDQVRSLNRIAQEEGRRSRPSVMDEQVFRTTVKSSHRRIRSRGVSLGDEALQGLYGLFARPSSELPTTIESQPLEDPFGPAPMNTLPPRLGSPFVPRQSHTFPRRQSHGGHAVIGRKASTMHRAHRSIESFDFGAQGLSLDLRLSHLDQRLTEIHDREAAQRQRQQQ